MLCAATSLAAQQVYVRGYGEADIDALVRAALAANPLILTRDTLITARDTVRRNIVVVKARFILEGTVQGDLTGLEANIYLRPNSHVTGQVLNVAGGLYPSELAKMGSVEDRPLAPYHVASSGADFTLEGKVKRPALRLVGGTQLPEYNRVDGLRVEVGPSILLPPTFGVEPIVSGSIGYATERKDFLGRAQLLLKRGRSSLAGGWEDDITLTNEAWIRSALKNSIAMLWNGKDYRNYYAADRTYLEFRRVLERGARTSQYWLRGQNELARSLAAGDPFVIWKPDSMRFNDPVANARITSFIAGARSQWLGTTSYLDISAHTELAGKTDIGGDYAFRAYQAFVEYAMKALANHTLHVTANFRGPLPGTDSLPQQRWTFVGGSNTLYTFRLNEFRGDRLAFVESEYRIPFAPQLRLPLLGQPTLRLMHNIGMAWSHDIHRRFEQNVGARLQFPFAYVRVVTNPRNISDKVKLDVGVSMPGKTYPWEKKPRTK
jgi:hypothetical protein